jgi:hypothetical protein
VANEKSLFDTIGSIFWGFILLLLVLAIGSGPTAHVDIIRLCFLAIIGGFFLFPKRISKKTFIFGEVGVWTTMLITAIISNDTFLILMPICIFFLLSIPFTCAYLKHRAMTKNPTP